MPGKCKEDRDEQVVVETVLPDKIDNGCYLCFRSAKQDMKFYVDGQLKKEYSTEKNRLFGRMSAAAKPCGGRNMGNRRQRCRNR